MREDWHKWECSLAGLRQMQFEVISCLMQEKYRFLPFWDDWQNLQQALLQTTFAPIMCLLLASLDTTFTICSRQSMVGPALTWHVGVSIKEATIVMSEFCRGLHPGSIQGTPGNNSIHPGITRHQQQPSQPQILQQSAAQKSTYFTPHCHIFPYNTTFLPHASPLPVTTEIPPPGVKPSVHIPLVQLPHQITIVVCHESLPCWCTYWCQSRCKGGTKK